MSQVISESTVREMYDKLLKEKDPIALECGFIGYIEKLQQDGYGIQWEGF